MITETQTIELPKTPDIKRSDVDIVKESREQLKAENDLLEGELLRKEKLRAEIIQGGRSFAATPVPVVETSKDYANKIMRGEIK